MSTDTSREAAQSVRHITPTQRDRILTFLRKRGDTGATDHEMQACLHMNPSTQRPRRIELEMDGYVKDSGQRRETPSQRTAIVWKAT